jgi:integrase
MLVLAVQTGLRISELFALTRGDVNLGTGAHVHCLGKGRKERATPLTTLTRHRHLVVDEAPNVVPRAALSGVAPVVSARRRAM